jgi:hypothetical protein
MKNQDFQREVIKKVDELAKYFEQFPWENKSFYDLWLQQTHSYVAYTSTFLKMCYELSPDNHPMKSRFKEHIVEEKGHERMSQNDLKLMKAPNLPVFSATGVFWKSQFYWIKEHSPSAHLGYILPLEGLAAKAGPVVLSRIQKAGHKGYTFLKVHAEEDQDHFAEAVRAVSDLSDSERKDIYQNMIECIDTYKNILAECKSYLTRTSSVAA